MKSQLYVIATSIFCVVTVGILSRVLPATIVFIKIRVISLFTNRISLHFQHRITKAVQFLPEVTYLYLQIANISC
jgi:hypothetical protein